MYQSTLLQRVVQFQSTSDTDYTIGLGSDRVVETGHRTNESDTWLLLSLVKGLPSKNPGQLKLVSHTQSPYSLPTPSYPPQAPEHLRLVRGSEEGRPTPSSTWDDDMRNLGGVSQVLSPSGNGSKRSIPLPTKETLL